jgi:flagellar basal-body rod protein FlgG
MNGAFYIGATGLDAQQRALDVVANNIANIHTPAFRRTSVQFSDLVAVPRDGADLPVAGPDGSTGLSGVRISSALHDWTTGELRRTGSAMDLAIDGNGFIEMMGPSGQMLLSRGGSLKVNAEGFLAAADGTALRAMISVPEDATQINISRDGAVSALVDGSTSQLGQIDLVMVKDADRLIDRGSGYYEALDDAQAVTVHAGDEGAGALVQGSIEQANVSLSDEMIGMMLVQRAYAANAQVVQAGDQLMSIANSLRR